MRNKTVDVLKTIAIIAVVIGHITIVLYPDTYETNIIFKLCYSFHMPLFIFLSGFLIQHNVVEKKYSLIKKTWRLLIPWLVWTFIAVCIDLNISNYGYSLIIKPRYWFLINNWLSFILLYLAIFCPLPTGLNIIIFYVLTLGVYHFFKLEILHAIQVFFPFYIFGFFVRYLKEYEKKLYPILKRIGLICLILYPLSMIFYAYGNASFEKQLQTLISILHINDSILKIRFLKILISIYSNWGVPLFGIGFYYTIVSLIRKKMELSKAALLGNYTLQIYVIHSFFIRDYVKNAVLSFMIQLFLCISIPVIIALLIKHSGFLDMILFGNTNFISNKNQKELSGCN